MTSSRWNTLEQPVRVVDVRGPVPIVARRRVVHDGRSCAQDGGRSRVVRRSPGLRLTRRGRVVLILLPLMALLVSALLAVAPTVASATDGAAATRTVTVHDGDTMWAIARRLAPRVDPRDAVLELEQVNRLTDAAIMPGQILRVPSNFAVPQ